MDERMPVGGDHLVEVGNGQEKLAPLLLIFSIGMALVLSILLLFFPWYYALAFLGVAVVATLTWIKPEIGLILLIITIPLEVYTTFFLGGLFVGFTATGLKLLGFTVVISWLTRMIVTGEKLRGMKTGGGYAILFLLVAALSLFAAENVLLGFSRWLSFMQLVALSFLCANLVTTPKILKRVLWFLIMAVTISSVLAILQYFEIIAARGEVVAWREEVRVVGGIAGPGYFALTLGMAFFISIGIFLQESSFFKKIVLASVGAFLIIALIFTFARAGAVAFVVALAYMIVRQRHRVGFIVIILILTAILIPFIPEAFMERLSPAYAMEDFAVRSRLHAWEAAIVMWWRNPIFGVGAGHFIIHSLEYLPPGHIERMVAHSSYLEVLAELGTLSFIFFLVLILGAYRSIRAFPHTVAGKEFKNICFGLELAFVILLVNSIFLSAQYTKELWLIIGLGMALREMSLREMAPKLVKEVV